MISLWQWSKQLDPDAEGGRALCKCFEALWWIKVGKLE